MLAGCDLDSHVQEKKDSKSGEDKKEALRRRKVEELTRFFLERKVDSTRAKKQEKDAQDKDVKKESDKEEVEEGGSGPRVRVGYVDIEASFRSRLWE